MERKLRWAWRVVTLAIFGLLAGGIPCAWGDELIFRRHELNPQSQYSAAAVLDLDNDGWPEIVAGAFAYARPNFQPQRVRDIVEIRGRYDDYSNLPLDVDRDGWVDLVSVNYRSESLFWNRNPGPAVGTWPMTVIDTPGPSETGRLIDINGDGHLDVLPNGTTYAAWYECLAEPADGKGAASIVWRKHDLPHVLAGHGLGAGDIDGDGRPDIVGGRGWARQTGSAHDPIWQFHAEFQLHPDASVPILVNDVDHDGDTDLVWSRGHDVGIYWLEQTPTAAGRQWRRHVIDTAISQVHAPMLGDLDGDGHPDLIAGKRFLGHDGRDPGEYDPLAIYWYRFDVSRRTWQRSTISQGGNWGIDLDGKVADVDRDGDLDIVAPARSGLAWFENLARPVVNAAQAPTDVPSDVPVDATLYHHDRMLELAAGRQGLVPITDLRAWGQRRAHIQEAMQQVMGQLPGSDRRVPLDIVDHEQMESDKFVRHRISYQAEPNDRVTAYLFIPKHLNQPAAAMLCLHPTSPLGKDVISGTGNDPGRWYALELAERGYVVIAPDYPSFGEYKYDFASDDPSYVSGSMKAIWNNLRAVDVLETVPEVDVDRIGCIGHSLGGHNALFTASFDQRLRAVATSCGFTAFSDYYQGNLKGWTSDRYMPRIQDVYGGDPSRMPFDFPEVLALMAPRGLFISAPLEDDNFAVEGVRRCVAAAQEVYHLFGDDQRLQVRYPRAGHGFPDDVRLEVYRWLDEQLEMAD